MGTAVVAIEGDRVIFQLNWRGNPERIFTTIFAMATDRVPGLRPPGRCPQRACPCQASASSDSRSFPSTGTGRLVSRSTNTCTK